MMNYLGRQKYGKELNFNGFLGFGGQKKRPL